MFLCDLSGIIKLACTKILLYMWNNVFILSAHPNISFDTSWDQLDTNDDSQQSTIEWTEESESPTPSPPVTPAEGHKTASSPRRTIKSVLSEQTVIQESPIYKGSGNEADDINLL
uniref:Uncharacterized protein n=1 Tax=Heterorhabditis bacteriophora TaxID=37862 RepID=A0A1I7XDM8_HETBA